LVDRIRKAGIQIETFGFGWPNGSISQEKMIDVFNQTKINLNLSNSVTNDIRYVLSGPRAFLNFMRSTKHGEQLKGRHIEINACGGFQLSFYADGIETVFEPNKEIAVYQSVDDLIEKIQFYLGHDELRARIAKAGYEKAQAKFEYTKRLEFLFQRIKSFTSGHT
jgi:spore maturation protein CgeB